MSTLFIVSNSHSLSPRSNTTVQFETHLIFTRLELNLKKRKWLKRLLNFKPNGVDLFQDPRSNWRHSPLAKYLYSYIVAVPKENFLVLPLLPFVIRTSHIPSPPLIGLHKYMRWITYKQTAGNLLIGENPEIELFFFFLNSYIVL